MPTCVSILRIPKIIWVWRATVEWYIDRGKPKDSEKNLSQCHLVCHKSHMDWPRCEPWPLHTLVLANFISCYYTYKILHMKPFQWKTTQCRALGSVPSFLRNYFLSFVMIM
jgi:hypothetical protein